MSHDPVISDLNRYLDDESRPQQWDDACDEKASELQAELSMRLWQSSTDGLWRWEILDANDDHIDGEQVKTESEAWVGMRQGMDKYTRKAAEEYFEQDS